MWLNLKRRHLNSSQLSFVALEIEAVYARDAKKRQLASLKQNAGQEPLPNSLGNGDKHKSEAAHQAAVSVGTNRQYIADAKKIRQESPDLERAVMSVFGV